MTISGTHRRRIRVHGRREARRLDGGKFDRQRHVLVEFGPDERWPKAIVQYGTGNRQVVRVNVELEQRKGTIIADATGTQHGRDRRRAYLGMY